MDHEFSTIIHLSFLKIDYDKLSTSPRHSLGNHVDWSYTQTGAKTKHEVSFEAGVPCSLDNIWIQLLSKIDNAVIQLPIAFFVIAHATCLVVLGFLCISHPEVAHVILFTRLTHFQVRVAVDFVYFISWNATLTMQAIDVLRDHFF